MTRLAKTPSGTLAIAVGVLLGGLLVGCPRGQLAPSLDLSGDPLLGRMPVDSTLLMGADLTAAQQGAGLNALLQHAGLDLDELLRRYGAHSGLQLRRDSLRVWQLACGERGCGLLARAQLDDDQLRRLAPAVGFEASTVTWQQDPTRGTLLGFEHRMVDGDPIKLQRLGPDLIAAGDQNLVEALSHGSPARFDAQQFAGAVPRGQLWLLASDPGRLYEQAARRLEQSPTPARQQLARRLRASTGPHRRAARLASRLALSLELGDPLALRLRLRARDHAAAGQLELLLNAARLGPGLGPNGQRIEVQRVGLDVEAQLFMRPADLHRWMEQQLERRHGHDGFAAALQAWQEQQAQGGSER